MSDKQLMLPSPAAMTPGAAQGACRALFARAKAQPRVWGGCRHSDQQQLAFTHSDPYRRERSVLLFAICNAYYACCDQDCAAVHTVVGM